MLQVIKFVLLVKHHMVVKYGRMFFSSANQVSEPEKLERQRRIAYLREQLKAFRDEEIMIGQQVDQFQQAISKCKEEQSRLG